jgi:hypothetical protein
MAENPNFSGEEAGCKYLVTTGDRSARSDAESKLCSHGMNARNLIVCIDGTANQFGEKARTLRPFHRTAS